MVVGKHTLVKELLTVVQTETTLNDALMIFKSTNYLSIPVMDASGKDFKGVLYKVNIYEGLVNSDLDKEEYLQLKVGDIFTPLVIQIQANSILEEAADLLTDAKQSFIPVYDKEEFIGILTHSSIFEAYSNLLGVHKGVRLSLTVTNLRGRLAMLATSVSKLGGDIISFAIEDTQVMNIARLVIRVENCDIDKFVKTIEKQGFKVERVDI